jgi:hypothetical protein
MPHLTVKTLAAHPPHEMTDAKHANEPEEILRVFAKHAVALRNVLYEDKPLNEMELVFIENHFHVLEMAFLRWKRQHGDIRH